MKAIALLLLTTLIAGCGVTASSRNPGYAQFDTPEHAGLKSDTSISLGPSILRFAAKHANNEDPQARALMESLDGIRVSVHTLSENVDHATLDSEVGIATAKAFDEQWSPIVRVLEDDSRVQIFVKAQDDMLLGIAIVAVDREELVFVNMMGEISMDSLQSVSSVATFSDSIALLAGDAD